LRGKGLKPKQKSEKKGVARRFFGGGGKGEEKLPAPREVDWKN